MSNGVANRFYVLTSMGILFVLGYLSYRIIHPFLSSIVWAIVLSIIFYPVYKFLLRYVKSSFFSSFFTIVLMLIVIIGPFFYLSLVFLDELRYVAEKLDKEALDSIEGVLNAPHIAKITKKAQAYFGIEGMSASDIIVGNLKKFGQVILDNFSSWIANITRAILDFIFMLFAIFFFLRDGSHFMKKIKDYLPFSEDHKNRLTVQVKDMIISTVYGGVVVAVVEGVLGGIAFYALDIKSPVLGGTAMAIMSFLPMLGTFSVWGPVGGYLIIHGSYMKGIGILVFGTLMVSIVDSTLAPMIVSGRTKLPTLLIFFSVIGGIHLFGFIGFIIGPLIMALFMSVFTIFRNIEGGEHA